MIPTCGSPGEIFQISVEFIREFCVADQCSQVKDEGICPGNVPRIYFDQAFCVRIVLVRLGNSSLTSKNSISSKDFVFCSDILLAHTQSKDLDIRMMRNQQRVGIKAPPQLTTKLMPVPQSAQRCLLFSYGGGGGNTNNFLTEDSCIAACGGPSGALVHAIQLHGALLPDPAHSAHPANSRNINLEPTVAARPTPLLL